MLKLLMIAQLSLLVQASVCVHPFMMSLTIVALAIITSIILLSKTSLWIASSLTIIFLGGMMVIFLYFTSLSNMEKLDLRPTISRNFTMLSVIFFFTLTPPVKHFSLVSLNLSYSTLGVVPMSMVVFYLLLTLFVVVKMAENFKGALEMSWF